MSESASAPFTPDWVSPPGDTILDMLEERDWSQQQLADRLGYSAKHVSQLITGKVSLSEDAAVRLHTVLGASIGFWLTREAQYRERLAVLDAAAKHAEMVPWLERFPLHEMIEMGVLTKRRVDKKGKPHMVAELLSFFGVATPEQWENQYGKMELAFRRSREDQADVAAISVWLRLGERIAERLDGLRYNEAQFRANLARMRALTKDPPEVFAPRINELMKESGVAFVIVPALPRCQVSGVARWLNPHRPMIQMSLYGKTNDKFWFSLFHEAAHILLHSKQKTAVYLDDPTKSASSTPEEQEANAWARDTLLAPDLAKQLPNLAATRSALTDFARRADVHPGVVVGRMQHDGLLDVRWLNDLKVSLDFHE